MKLTTEQTLIRDTAADFAQSVLAPQAGTNDAKSLFPAEAIKQMGQLGFMGMLVPESFGGANTDNVSYALALEEIAAGEGATSTIMSVHNSVGCMPLLNFGSSAQQQKYLPAMATGELLAAFCLTEPDAGSDASAIRTTAAHNGDHYLLNGTKQFITNGKSAGIAIVFARTGEGKQ
ncbi:MAG: butyryl-CoA dehydrogenase, partial [Flavobacteriaceae bacterium]